MSEYFDNKQLFATPTVSQYNNHMVMTNVSKETKKKYLNIDTKFCDEYVNNRDPNNPLYNQANYNITLPDRINDVKSISLVNAEIPMTFYNISAALGNNCFSVQFYIPDNISFNIIIPDGQYDISFLLQTINSQFGYPVGINDQDNYPTFGIYSNKVFMYLTLSGRCKIDFAVDNKGNFDKYNFKSKLGWLLGFRQTSYILNGSNYPVNILDYKIAENKYNLNNFRYFYLAIDEFSKGNQNSFMSALPNSSINKNIIAKICLDLQFYPLNSILNANVRNGLLMSDKRSYTGKTDIQKLNIQLLDDLGRPVNLGGFDFSFGLEIDYE
jgi:hypothetical protein